VVSPSLPNPFQDDRLTDADAFDTVLDVPTVHQEASDYLLDSIARTSKLRHPDGRAKIAAVLSIPGVGKTHVIGRVQHRLGNRAVFVFVPQVEEHGSAIKHIHWHVLKRLFGAPPDQRPLIHGLLAQLCQHSFRKYFDALPHTVKEQHKTIRERLDGPSVDPILEIVNEAKEPGPFLSLGNSIASRYPALHNTAIRALVLGWSPFRDDAWRWLRGEQVDEKRLAELRLPPAPPDVTAILKALTGLMHPLKVPVVICCDQSEKLLRWPNALNEFTTALMGWVDDIPNLVLAMTFLKDDWKKLNDSFQSFCDRTHGLVLEPLQGAQAVELISKRIAMWPGARPEKGRIWPFNEEQIVKLASNGVLYPRGLLKQCSAGFETWLSKRSQQPIEIEDKTKQPVEELFRQEWNQTLATVRKEQVSAENLQEERLFRSARECLVQVQLDKVPVAGMDVLQLQDDKIKKQFAVHVKLGVHGTNEAVPVVLAVTKLTGGTPLTAFFKGLDESLKAPVAGAILIRPKAKMTLGERTEGKKAFEKLKAAGRLRVYDLDEHRTAFEQMECYLRLLDRAAQKEMLLGQQTITVDQFRELSTRTKILNGLNLLEKVCAGWVPVSSKVAIPAIMSAPTAPVNVSLVGAMSKPAGGGIATQSPPETKLPSSETGDNDWANQILRALSVKLNEFGQKVEPIGVLQGPTFVRFKLKPLGKTSIGKVRNHANDLRTHIAAITDVPVITDQPGFISIDIRRPDRQVVGLAQCLANVPPDLLQKPAFPVGVDVTGKPYWLNLAEPATCHILAAGTTGSGKSEFLKAMIASLAARLSPLELQFVLVDPKRVTFNFHGKSPYLLRPVAHTVEEAMVLMQACFAETERRYKVLQSKGLEHVGQLKGQDGLTRIVVVFDEFADLMAEPESKRELEGSLKRIGALARAAGIHLVLATQRPDKDVVTPLLRANLPTRICLRVDGERNSKIILDEEGGENLLGNGDLFWKQGSGMLRLQGAFAPKQELEKLLRIETT
jgi:S-DNA-T family DNA segregation ATPase FtsK/SpoIIIE